MSTSVDKGVLTRKLGASDYSPVKYVAEISTRCVGKTSNHYYSRQKRFSPIAIAIFNLTLLPTVKLLLLTFFASFLDKSLNRN